MMPRRFRRRIATDSQGLAVVTAPGHVMLQRVSAAWASAVAGRVVVTVDGSTVAEADVAGGVGSVVLRLDRPELLARGATITVSLPAVGTAEVAAVVR